MVPRIKAIAVPETRAERSWQLLSNNAWREVDTCRCRIPQGEVTAGGLVES